MHRGVPAPLRTYRDLPFIIGIPPVHERPSSSASMRSRNVRRSSSSYSSASCHTSDCVQDSDGKWINVEVNHGPGPYDPPPPQSVLNVPLLESAVTSTAVAQIRCEAGWTN